MFTDYNDNILISIFWPPTKNYVMDEQYKYMADAEIDWVMGSGDAIGEKETQMKMLELCEKYGIGMTVGDDRMGSKLIGQPKEKVIELVNEYKHMKAAKGYYILDEPKNPNVFIDAYKALNVAAPNDYMHLNFNPFFVYASIDEYIAQMNDWCKLCAETGYPLTYLMFDQYPFGLEKSSMDRTSFLKNLNAARIAGLRNNVKTANYIQAVKQCVAFRSLNKAETLYEINMSLAYGIKQISYFTWFTPFERSEPFDDGIISKDGVPNSKYKFICELDKFVHKIGKTIIKCDAMDVYASTEGYGVQNLIPSDFIMKVTNDANLTVSVMRHKDTLKNYLYIVNNDFDNPQDIALLFDKKINSLEVLSDEGEVEKLPMRCHKVSKTLGAGEAIIVILPIDLFAEKDVWKQENGENIARKAEISCNKSKGEDGWYMEYLNDGICSSEDVRKGWMCEEDTATITLDFGSKDATFNEIKLYPAGKDDNYGEYFLKDFDICVSDDGKNFRKITQVRDAKLNKKDPFTVNFDTTSGRFLRIDVLKGNGKIALAEIETFLK